MIFSSLDHPLHLRVYLIKNFKTRLKCPIVGGKNLRNDKELLLLFGFSMVIKGTRLRMITQEIAKFLVVRILQKRFLNRKTLQNTKVNRVIDRVIF